MARLGDYNVMRYGEIVGYSTGRKVVSIATRRPSLVLALEAARQYQRGMPTSRFWIAKVHERAHFRSMDRREHKA
jgi:hypothetical protein